MKTNQEFINYLNDYQAFTGQTVDEKNTESLSLFFQYLQARNILEVKNNIIEQNRGISQLIELLRAKLG